MHIRAPRVCGDDPGRAPRYIGVPGVLPAYAGMILSSSAWWLAAGCAPRVCGDDPDVLFQILEKVLCSPRMRG